MSEGAKSPTHGPHDVTWRTAVRTSPRSYEVRFSTEPIAILYALSLHFAIKQYLDWNARDAISSAVLSSKETRHPYAHENLPHHRWSYPLLGEEAIGRTRPYTVLQMPKEVYVGKFLHLVNISCLSDLFIIEKNPRASMLLRNLLAYKRYVVSSYPISLVFLMTKPSTYPA